MEQDKFTHIFRLPGSIQVRIAKWQQTFRGKSDLVLHQALVARNHQYQQDEFLPKVGASICLIRTTFRLLITVIIFKPQCAL